jgi:hypothetical protein
LNLKFALLPSCALLIFRKEESRDRTATTNSQKRRDRQNWIGTTGQVEQDRQNRTGRKGLPDRATRTELPEQHSQCMTARIRQPGQDIDERTARKVNSRTGKAEQDSQK